MDIFTELDDMQRHINAADWDAFVLRYDQLCLEYGKVAFDQIQSADISDYTQLVGDAMASALEIAKRTDSKAIYFEYDLDNNWDSNFFICGKYNPPEKDDDDWASDFENDVPAGDFPSYSDVYNDTDNFCNTDSATAVTLCLVARTTRCLMTVAGQHDFLGVTLCLGFHGQDPIHRTRIAG